MKAILPNIVRMSRPTKRGIYAVVHERTGKIQYVGKSDKSIDRREEDHKENGRYHPGIEKVLRVHVPGQTLRANVEARLIENLNPPRNRKGEPLRGGLRDRVESWIVARRVRRRLRD